MLLEVVDIRFPEMIFAKSYTESIFFETVYEFFGHFQLEPPFSNDIRISFSHYNYDDYDYHLSSRYNYECYFTIKNEGYKIEIDFCFEILKQ